MEREITDGEITQQCCDLDLEQWCAGSHCFPRLWCALRDVSGTIRVLSLLLVLPRTAAFAYSVPPVRSVVSPLTGGHSARRAALHMQNVAAEGPAEDAAALSAEPEAPEASSAEAKDAAPEEDTLVQFVVVRRDLLKNMEWPVGSVIAQACHACLAVAWEHRDDPDVASYLGDVDSMHKVVKECKGEPQIRTLADKLTAEGVAYKLWVEQPEGIPTAIALKPYPRSRVAPLLKKYNLFK